MLIQHTPTPGNTGIGGYWLRWKKAIWVMGTVWDTKCYFKRKQNYLFHPSYHNSANRDHFGHPEYKATKSQKTIAEPVGAEGIDCVYLRMRRLFGLALFLSTLRSGQQLDSFEKAVYNKTIENRWTISGFRIARTEGRMPIHSRNTVVNVGEMRLS